MRLWYELQVRLEHVWYMARFRVAQSCYVLSKGLADAAVKICPENAAWITHTDTQPPD